MKCIGPKVFHQQRVLSVIGQEYNVQNSLAKNVLFHLLMFLFFVLTVINSKSFIFLRDAYASYPITSIRTQRF